MILIKPGARNFFAYDINLEATSRYGEVRRVSCAEGAKNFRILHPTFYEQKFIIHLSEGIHCNYAFYLYKLEDIMVERFIDMLS